MPDGTGSENPVIREVSPNDWVLHSFMHAFILHKTLLGVYLCQGMCISC